MFRNGLQPQHLLLLLLIVLILFGANRLPDLARSVGKSARILKEEARELKDGQDRKPADTPSADGEQPAPR